MEFQVLAIGDVVGNPGMERVRRKLRQLKRKTGADFVIVNGENASVPLERAITMRTCIPSMRRKICVLKELYTSFSFNPDMAVINIAIANPTRPTLMFFQFAMTIMAARPTREIIAQVNSPISGAPFMCIFLFGSVCLRWSAAFENAVRLPFNQFPTRLGCCDHIQMIRKNQMHKCA